jgi:hypothetical protein
MAPRRVSGNVRLLAYAYIGICGAAIIAGLYICIGLALSGGPNAGRALGTIGMPFLLLSIVYFIPGFVGGQGLLRGKSWARSLIIALSVLVLFAVSVGTVFGGWGLWVPWRRPEAPVGNPAAVSFPPLTADQKSRMGAILIAMVAVASLFVVMLGTGARVTHDTRVQVDGIVYYPDADSGRAHRLRHSPVDACTERAVHRGRDRVCRSAAVSHTA